MDVKSSSIVKIYLKQQTPMIHFQHSEAGATLRATEVKPKLDKFIKEYVKHIDDEWYIDKNKKEAFRYKMRIVAKGEPIKSKEIKAACDMFNLCGRTKCVGVAECNRTNCKGVTVVNPICKSYFGNMANIKDILKKYKETVFYNEKVELTIFCMIEELREEIKKLVPAFFLLHNFGTRQSKGFGSFKVTGICEEEVNNDAKDIIQKYAPNSYFVEDEVYIKNDIEIERNNEIIKVSGYNLALDDINMIYGFMKGGHNFTKEVDSKETKISPQDYFKGFIFTYYMKYQGFSNDKAFIKQKILVNEWEKEGIEEKFTIEKDFRFVRAVLGLPAFFRFDKIKGRPKVFHWNDKKIQRFQSPIMFKIVDKYIFIMPKKIRKEVYKELEYATFYFYKDQNNRDNKIIIPKKFDVFDFLKEFSKDFNDKDLKKGGEIGIKEAKNPALQRAKDLYIKNLGGEVIE